MTNSSENDGRIPASNIVLDSSALLAAILDEPGAEVVREHLRDGASISAVNLCEVVSKLARDGYSEDQISSTLTTFHFSVVGLGEETAFNAGLLVRQTSSLGLSMGDRCCLALADELGLRVLTADRIWAQLDVGVEVVVCR